jgi:hypothetical protein
MMKFIQGIPEKLLMEGHEILNIEEQMRAECGSDSLEGKMDEGVYELLTQHSDFIQEDRGERNPFLGLARQIFINWNRKTFGTEVSDE